MYAIGSGYLGFCLVSSGQATGIIEIGGKTLSSLTVTVEGKTITYGDGIGSSRLVKKLYAFND